MGKDTHRDPRFTYNGRPVLIEGHRGYKGRFPENTLLSFDEAIKAGAGQLEFDIRAAGDGTVFVFHDANVDRTTNGSGPLSSLTYDEVKELDAGSWFGPEFKGEKVPTLAEALDFLKGKARLNIEVKTSDTTEELWKTAVRGAVVEIDKRDMWEQVIFSSFSPEALWYVKELKPEAALGLLDWDLTRENNNKQKLLDMGGKYWLLHGSLLSEEVISEAHRQGLEVFSGVGDDPDGLEARLKAALDMGLDVIATDHAGEVWEALKRIL